MVEDVSERDGVRHSKFSARKLCVSENKHACRRRSDQWYTILK